VQRKSKRMLRKCLYITEEDQAALADICDEYGCVSESQAMRFALRALRSRSTDIPLPELSRYARRSPKR